LKVVGVDLGGTTFTVGLVDEKGNILKEEQHETRVWEGFEKVTERVAEVIVGMKDDAEIVGIGSPGSIVNGVVRFSPNFPGWIDVPLADRIRNLTGLLTFVENDANSFVLCEKWFGAGKGYDHIVALTLGTGVGGGVITHGVLLKGYLGIGAELGHVLVEPGGPACGCGNYGCLEALASATAIVRMANEMKVKYPDSVIFKSSKITAKVVMDAAREGDELGIRIRDRVADALARAIASFAHIFNPQVVILGGGVSRAGDVLLKPLRMRVRDYLMPSFIDTFDIVISPLLDRAGVLGAASVAFENMGR
jgi:glucokinase